MRFIFYTFLISTPLVAAKEQHVSLPSLDLDSLMKTDVHITAPMKRLQSLSETASSIYVVQNEELVRSGVTSIPQALTLVPGLQVRKIDNNLWAITARFPAGRYSSKMLVMIDGQSIQNPGFAGTDWESINIPIFDIERIEVIKGQAGLLWGSNATNGTINIITKHSEDTRSTIIQAETGSQLDHQLTGRFGSDLGASGAYRVYASTKKSDRSSRSSKGSPSDSGETSSVGFKTDLVASDDVSMKIQGDLTQVTNGQTVKLANQTTNQSELIESEYERDDVKLLARVEHRASESSNQAFQLAYMGLNSDSAYHEESFDIIDASYQMNSVLYDTYVDWGLDYQHTSIDSADTHYLKANEPNSHIEKYGFFAQLQFDLLADELTLSLGNRSEHNDFTGWEHQPIARMVWTPTSKQVLWGSLSQGVRIPSLLEQNGTATASGIRVGELVTTNNSTIDNYHVAQIVKGNSDVEAEKTTALDIGYRYIESDWNLDINGFATESKNALALQTDLDPYSIDEILALGNPLAIYAALQNSTVINNFVSNAELTTYGGEVLFKKSLTEKITAEIGYNYTSFEYDLQPDTTQAIGNNSDLNQFFFKASAKVTQDHYVMMLYRYEEGSAYQTDDFGALDLSWNWLIDDTFAFTLTGNNLIAGEYQEYDNTGELFTVPTYIESSVVARLSANF